MRSCRAKADRESLSANYTETVSSRPVKTRRSLELSGRAEMASRFIDLVRLAQPTSRVLSTSESDVGIV